MAFFSLYMEKCIFFLDIGAGTGYNREKCDGRREMSYSLNILEHMEFLARTGTDASDARLFIDEVGHSKPYGGKRVAVRTKNYHLHYFAGGKGTFNGTEIETGDVFLVRPGDWYEETADRDDPFEQYWINFDGSEAPGLLERAGIPDEAHRFRIDSPELAAGFFREALTGDVRLTGNPLYLAGLLLRLLALHGKSAEEEESGYAKKVCELIRKRYREPLRAGELAAEVGLSPKYLSRVFRRETGKTLPSCLTQVRLDAARLLLTHTDWSIDKIAREVGYGDPLYFSKVFARQYGLSPGRWRKNESG